MGEWMYADFQYEYFNDCSFFEQKSYQAVEGWKSLGRAAWDDPVGMVVPGVMEAWRNPTSPRAWGKAAVDIGLIGFRLQRLEMLLDLVKLADLAESYQHLEKLGMLARRELKLRLLLIKAYLQIV